MKVRMRNLWRIREIRLKKEEIDEDRNGLGILLKALFKESRPV
jgi:hypothetical protein